MFNASIGETSKVIYWLNTIKIRAKNLPVIVVGTHLDKCKPNQIKEINQKLQIELKQFKITFLTFVSSHSHDGIKLLRSKLVDVAFDEKLVGGRVSKKWIELGKTFINLRFFFFFLLLNFFFLLFIFIFVFLFCFILFLFLLFIFIYFLLFLFIFIYFYLFLFIFIYLFIYFFVLFIILFILFVYL